MVPPNAPTPSKITIAAAEAVSKARLFRRTIRTR